MTTATFPARAASKLTPGDRKLFKGTAAEVQPWMSNEEVLSSIDCNFTVESCVPSVYGREYNEARLWLRSDNGNHLGTFGNRRKVIQPGDFVSYFRQFCEQSNKAIDLDLVGTPDGGKTFYMASKLVNGNLQGLMEENRGRGLEIKNEIDAADRTEAWLIITDYYGESAAPKGIILLNELVCYNGMTKRAESRLAGLTHLKQQNGADVARVILDALEQVSLYQSLKERLIRTPVTADFATNCIRHFYRPAKEESVSRKAEKVLDVYHNRLIGGELATRRGTAWGLLSAVTQVTTHERVNDSTEGQGRAFKSMIDGPRASEARGFASFLEERLAAV